MNYFKRYEKGERSLYKFNGELKKPNMLSDPAFNRLLFSGGDDLYNQLMINTILYGRGVGFANATSIPTRRQSIGRIIRDEVFTWS